MDYRCRDKPTSIGLTSPHVGSLKVYSRLICNDKLLWGSLFKTDSYNHLLNREPTYSLLFTQWFSDFEREKMKLALLSSIYAINAQVI